MIIEDRKRNVDGDVLAVSAKVETRELRCAAFIQEPSPVTKVIEQ